jgi:hypothetical protein
MELKTIILIRIVVFCADFIHYFFKIIRKYGSARALKDIFNKKELMGSCKILVWKP